MPLTGSGTPRPRLLFVSRKWPPAIGGMESYSVELAASLDAHFDVDRRVLPGREDGAPPGLLAYGAFVLKAMVLCLLRGRQYPFVVFADVLLFPAALVHALVAPRACRAVVVYGLDLVYGTRPGLLPKFYRLFLATVVMGQRALGRVVAISRYTAGLARDAGFRDVHVVHPALPDSPLTRPAPPRDTRALRDGFARVVLVFGRLVPRKGALWFARQVLPRLPQDVGLLVAGPATRPEHLDELRAMPRVRTLGPVDAATLAALIRDADVVAMPNIRTPESVDVEGFGLVAIETSSLGGRLLASGLDGIRDAVVDGVTGTLVEPGDADAWAQAVNASLDAMPAEEAEHRTRIAEATRAAYSRSVQGDAFRRLLCGNGG